MKPAIKKKWVSALKSGEYRQSFGAIRRGKNCFCPIGVLTDLYFKEKGIKDGWKPEKGNTECPVRLDIRSKKPEYTYSSGIPEYVVKWASVRSDAKKIDEIMVLNDIEMLPLAKIASVIDKKL